MKEKNSKQVIFDTLKYLAITIGIALSTLQIWDWVTEPKPELVATVHFSEFMIPPPITSKLQEIYNQSRRRNLDDEINISKIREEYFPERNLLEQDNIRNILDSKKASDDLTEIVKLIQEEQDIQNEKQRKGINEITKSYEEIIQNRLNYEMTHELTRLSGIWFIDIENVGDRTANQVVLKTPDAKLNLIARENKDPATALENNIIELGDIQPKETVSIVAWTGTRPFFSDKNDIRLTHNTGIGTIDVYAPTSPFWNWMHRWQPMLIYIFAILLPFLIIFAIAATKGSGSVKNGSGRQSEENEQSDGTQGTE